MTLLNDTGYLFIRYMKKLIRNPILLFFSIVQPIIFLVLFTQLFERFANVPGFPAESYLIFATPGILLQNAFGSALQSGNSIVSDFDSGYLQKMLVTPVSRYAILLGRLTSDAFRVLIQSTIIMVLAFLLGARPVTGILGMLLMLLTIAFFGLAWSGISLAIGLNENAKNPFSQLELEKMKGVVNLAGTLKKQTLSPFETYTFAGHFPTPNIYLVIGEEKVFRNGKFLL